LTPRPQDEIRNFAASVHQRLLNLARDRGADFDPEISARTYRGHPHLYHPDVICPLFPPEKTWSWHTHNLVDYLGHVAVWLLKSQVWMATRDANGKGLWIGPDVSHDAEMLLRLVAPGDPCHCGSGRKYKQCHRPHDAVSFMAERGRDPSRLLRGGGEQTSPLTCATSGKNEDQQQGPSRKNRQRDVRGAAGASESAR
jgi:hypothetical protein